MFHLTMFHLETSLPNVFWPNEVLPKNCFIVPTCPDLTRVTDQAFGYYLTPAAGCRGQDLGTRWNPDLGPRGLPRA
jgi:hypothetical protein